MRVPFNKPYLTSKEMDYISDALNLRKISGNGKYTKKCQTFFESNYGFKKVLLTTSCTDALEMTAILANIELGDEVIVPSFTFVSTAIAFVRQGAKIVFVDSCDDNPNIDVSKIESLITSKTKVIVPVHYAGVACDMDEIMELANKYNLIVIEDAAQAIDSYYIGNNGVKRPLGSIGHMAAFSFHETKNIISGEGGMITINDSRFIERAEIIWEKGTNRSEFLRGEVNKYGWVDTGSSFLPSEITAAFLWAQIQNLDEIQEKRKKLWDYYYDALKSLNLTKVKLPSIPEFATNNGHMFYLVCCNIDERDKLISKLKQKGFHSVFHYISLHSSNFYISKHDNRELSNSDKYTNCLVRLPFFFELEKTEVDEIIECIKENMN